MSGHSKWATTHRQKEVKDAKKGAVFTKMGAQIAVAVREGGGIGDPEKNFHLRLVIDKAREYNMPKENIARAIEKGMGGGSEIALTRVAYEGFAPSGVGVIIDAVTDNKARTAQQVRTVLESGGGVMGVTGSVGHLFSRLGELTVDLENKNSDEAELMVIDLGANDFESDSGKLYVYCDKENTFNIKAGLEQKGYKVLSADLVMKPGVTVEVMDPEAREKVETLISRLEDLDDVARVWTNYA